MMIQRAEKEEYEQIRSFYYEVIDGFAGRDYHPGWTDFELYELNIEP